jgi:hypothetical protein
MIQVGTAVRRVLVQCLFPKCLRCRQFNVFFTWWGAECRLNGSIAPDIGSMLIRALAEQGKLIELQELTERLQRIEHQLELRQ